LVDGTTLDVQGGAELMHVVRARAAVFHSVVGRSAKAFSS
jgi:hypothetical protein